MTNQHLASVQGNYLVQDAIKFLRWLLDEDTSTISQLADIPDLIVELAVSHRIVGRVLQRLIQNEIPIEYSLVYEKLARIQLGLIDDFTKKYKTSLHFFRKLETLNQQFIIVKGYDTFYRTYNPFYIRRAGDFDVIVPDSHKLFSALSDLNENEYEVPAVHEEMNVTFNSMYFDFHRFFPIWIHTNREAISPDNIIGEHRVVHKANVEVKELNYEELLDDCTSIIEMNSLSILYPRATTASYIKMVHLYRDFIRLYSTATRERPRIRLQELLEIRDLISCPEFDPNRFIAMVEKFGTQEEALFVASMLDVTVHDKTLLNYLNKQSLYEGFDAKGIFICDVWHGFSFQIRRSPAEIIFSRLIAPDIVSEIESNVLKPEIENLKVEFSTEDDSSIFHTHGDIEKGFVTLTIKNGIVIVNMRFSRLSNKTNPAHTYISFADEYIQINFSASDPRRRYRMTKKIVLIYDEYRSAGNGYIIDVQFKVDSDCKAKIDNRILIGFGFILPEGQMDCGVLLPIHLKNIY